MLRKSQKHYYLFIYLFIYLLFFCRVGVGGGGVKEVWRRQFKKKIKKKKNKNKLKYLVFDVSPITTRKKKPIPKKLPPDTSFFW